MFKAEFIYRLVRSVITTFVFIGVLLLAEFVTDSVYFDKILDSNELLSTLISKAFVLSHITGFAKVFFLRKKKSNFLVSEQSDFTELLTYFLYWNLLSFFVLVLIKSFTGELSFNVNLLDIAVISLLSIVNLSLNISINTNSNRKS
jgi:hypothetical protein